MAVCVVQDLIDPCFYNLDPNKAEVVELAMLCGIKNKLDSDEPVTCDIQTLLDESECFYDLSPQMRRAVKLQLLCDILNLL